MGVGKELDEKSDGSSGDSEVKVVGEGLIELEAA